MDNIDIIRKINEISEIDGRYHRDAFIFILAALEHTLMHLRARRHLSGQELSYGTAEYAREQYGYMTQNVLERWGIKGTSDFGELVYIMINNGLMAKTEHDRKEDFNDVFDFSREFGWSKIKTVKLPERF